MENHVYESRIVSADIEHSTLKSVAFYEIVSKLSSKDNRILTPLSVQVRRRYRDFVLLQEALRDSHPGIILSPLPPATIHVFPTRDFIERRMVLLQRYLDNILKHPLLSSDPIYLMFLKSSDFAKNLKGLKLQNAAMEVVNRLGRTLDGPCFNDHVDSRLEQLKKIVNRLEILKIGMAEFYAAKQNLADRITDIAKSLTTYLDANTNSGTHARLVQLVESLDAISEFVAAETGQPLNSKNFMVIVDDHLRLMGEVEQTYKIKCALRSAVYTLDVQCIDLKSTVISMKDEKNFDREFQDSSQLVAKKRDRMIACNALGEFYRKMDSELDRIDEQRMGELESCLDELLGALLDSQIQVSEIWENFLKINLNSS